MSDVAHEAVAPGTDGVPGAGIDPNTPAGAQNTAPGQAEPGPIPYDRFKEVNDRLRPYAELERAGYTADSLRGLVEWEHTFQLDPVTNWMQVAKNIEGLPEGIQMAIADHFDEPYDPDSDDDDGGDDDTPAYDPKQDPEVRDAIEYAKSAREREAREERLGLLNSITSEWDKANEAQGLEKLPEELMLSFIAGAAGTGGNDAAEIMNTARNDWLKVREMALRHQVKPGSTGLPPSVPSGAATPTAERPRAKTFAEMNALISAAEQQGTL